MWAKTVSRKLLSISSPNIDRFSKKFQHILWKLCNTVVFTTVMKIRWFASQNATHFRVYANQFNNLAHSGANHLVCGNVSVRFISIQWGTEIVGVVRGQVSPGEMQATKQQAEWPKDKEKETEAWRGGDWWCVSAVCTLQSPLTLQKVTVTVTLSWIVYRA